MEVEGYPVGGYVPTPPHVEEAAARYREATEAGRRLAAARWQTPERREAQLRELAAKIAGLTDGEYRKLKEMVEMP